jgi:hypothetical protein
MPPKPTYSQRLPELQLSIEQNSANVPQDNCFYILRAGEQLGRYRSLTAARKEWQTIIEESGWKPAQRGELTAQEKLRREKLARDRSDYFEYWNSGRRHSW